MNKLIVSILWLFFPVLAFASDSGGSALSFAPPPGDYSVVFLGNLFGIVDGVLHGTGSQMMGNIFGVFNSAVLALGGIIIMYTVLVSTMNTAKEGKMLGEKWSSIWVPMRSTLGLALLVPKATGYCLMQILVMWIVVQGIGAADKVWGAALSYLNRGGVIVQSQMQPAISLNSDSSAISKGALTILAGQVCMVGLQNTLETQRQNYLNAKQSGSGPCSGTPSPAMEEFCATPVPDFLGTVNAVAVQSNDLKRENFRIDMPNFEKEPYKSLNAKCGTLTWNAISSGLFNTVEKNISLSGNELNTAKMSRAIAIQQMYLDLSTVARVMINNSPGFNSKWDKEDKDAVSKVALQQFGVPLMDTGKVCTDASDKCIGWGQDPGSSSAPVYSGTEFQGAIADYNGIMLPTLGLIRQAEQNKNAGNERKFIQQANAQGWILAGSYFFDLARLSSTDGAAADLTDKNTGLENSAFDTTGLDFGGKCDLLCQWLNKDSSRLDLLVGLIDGTSVVPSKIPPPVLDSKAPARQSITGKGASTVYGFVNNSVMVTLPGQPGMKPPAFGVNLNLKIDGGQLQLPNLKFPCGRLPLIGCFGNTMADIIYNYIIKNVFNYFISLALSAVNALVMVVIALPLLGMAEIFKAGVAIIQQPSVNPVIALANMGVNYINFASELWLAIIAISVSSSLLGPVGIFVMALLALVMPLLLAWMGVMVGIGFITAYYIPFVPYMIFTFGAIAWFVAVIEAMVAAPIVALGVTHPEGDGAFGKGEHAIMILMNIFLRPSMMIIGYIAAIALSYVSVWIINAGFANAMVFIQGTGNPINFGFSLKTTAEEAARNMSSMKSGYTGWAGVYGFFFSLLAYTTMYLIVVQKAFNLITYLPDRVLRWIGSQEERIGQESTQWGEEVKRVGEKAGEGTMKASQQMDQQLSGYAKKGIAKLQKGGNAKGSSVSATGDSSTPKPPEG